MKTSHIMCTSKILTDSCFTKQIIRTKNTFTSYLQSFSSKNVLTEHEQSAKLEKGTIKFKNYFKRILVPYKVYTDFECNLTSTECKY